MHRLLFIVGVLGALASGWMGARSAWRWLAAPGQPAPGDATAPAGRWTLLRGVELDCDTFRAGRGESVAVATGGGEVVLVVWEGEAPCRADALPDGAFLPGRFTRDFVRARVGVDLPPGPDLRVFAEALAPRFQRNAAARMLPWLGAGLILAFTGWRGMRRAREEQDRRKSGRGAAGR